MAEHRTVEENTSSARASPMRLSIAAALAVLTVTVCLHVALVKSLRSLVLLPERVSDFHTGGAGDLHDRRDRSDRAHEALAPLARLDRLARAGALLLLRSRPAGAWDVGKRLPSQDRRLRIRLLRERNPSPAVSWCRRVVKMSPSAEGSFAANNNDFALAMYDPVSRAHGRPDAGVNT